MLVVLLVYIISLLFREFFGRKSYFMTCAGECNVDIQFYFASVPRCMFTVFRFFFNDFTTDEGVSLFEGVQGGYGTLAGAFVAILFFGISVGIFNVIAAIFVESTLAAASTLQSQRKTYRLNDVELWSTRIRILISKLFEHHGTLLDPFTLSESLESISMVPVTEREFNSFIQDEVVIACLDSLEIDAADHKYLFDILDNDNTGSIFVSQLVDGLQRLRGDPRRSDIITVDLMVRAIQEQTSQIVNGMDTALEILTVLMKDKSKKTHDKKHSAQSSSSLDIKKDTSKQDLIPEKSNSFLKPSKTNSGANNVGAIAWK